MKRQREIDNRPRWNDPNLPCFQADGNPITAYEAQQQALAMMGVLPVRLPDGRVGYLMTGLPDWRHDPTYNLKRRSKNP